MKTTIMLCLLLAYSVCAQSQEGPPQSLARVRVNVRNLPDAVAWFQHNLDWRPTFRNEFSAVFLSSGTRLQLDSAVSDSTVTLVLASEETDADYRRLLSRGARSILEPTDRPSGFREATLQGPGDVTIEIDGPLAHAPDFEYFETTAGTGETPTPSDTVKVRYVGTLKDGTVFDSAHEIGRPALIPLRAAVPCWTQALTRMKVGGKSNFVCPPGLAYGKAGRPPRVPPNAVLLFTVELLGVMR